MEEEEEENEEQEDVQSTSHDLVLLEVVLALTQIRMMWMCHGPRACLIGLKEHARRMAW